MKQILNWCIWMASFESFWNIRNEPWHFRPHRESAKLVQTGTSKHAPGVTWRHRSDCYGEQAALCLLKSAFYTELARHRNTAVGVKGHCLAEAKGIVQKQHIPWGSREKQHLGRADMQISACKKPCKSQQRIWQHHLSDPSCVSAGDTPKDSPLGQG